MKLSALCSLVVAVTAAAGDGDAGRLKDIQRKAQTCSDCLLKADYGKLLEMTHPKVVEKAGGKEKMAEKLKTEMSALKDKGFVFRSLKVDLPAKIYRGETEWFAIAPNVIEMDIPGGKARIKSFLLAVSADQGKRWWFVDGGGGPAKLRSVFPNIPKDLEFPAKEPPVIEKNP